MKEKCISEELLWEYLDEELGEEEESQVKAHLAKCPSCNHQYLSEINLYFIRAINGFLGINTRIVSSSDFVLAEDRTQRLVDICKSLSATNYYSGPAAKSYMQQHLFEDAGIVVNFFDYTNYTEYPQMYPPFQHSVTMLDLLFNLGEDAKNYYKLTQ